MVINSATPFNQISKYQSLIKFEAIRNKCKVGNINNNKRTTNDGRIQYEPRSPSDVGTPQSLGETWIIYQLGGQGPTSGGDEDPHGDEEDHGEAGRHGRDNYYKEFTWASPSKIVIKIFIGTNFHDKLYMPFNKDARKLIRAQGARRVLLSRMFGDVEEYGDMPYDDNKSEVLAMQCPRAYEYSIAIQNVSDNYTADIVEGMIKCWNL